jgi:hypothetical protein
MRIFTIVLLIIAFSYNIHAQSVPNGDFELGADTLSLKDWHTINELTGIFFPFTRTTDAYSGGYAVKLQTLEIFNTKVPGIISLGKITIGNVQGSIYFPYKPDKLIGMYKHPTDKDASLISVFFLKNDGNKVDTIGKGSFIPEGNVNEYEQFEIDIVYKSTVVPDSMNIILISDSEVANSTFYIDNLEFIYNTINVHKIQESKVEVYPNPANSFIIIKANGISDNNYLLMNLFGKILMSGTVDENSLIDISKHPAGVYFIVIDNKKIKILKN